MVPDVVAGFVKKGPVIRKKIIVSDELNLEVRARWHAWRGHIGGSTKVILRVERNGQVGEFCAIWANSDSPCYIRSEDAHEAKTIALEDARMEARWAVESFLRFLANALKRKTVSVLDELMLHFRVYKFMQDRDSLNLLRSLRDAGDFARLVEIAYSEIFIQTILKHPRDYEEELYEHGQKIQLLADWKDAETIDLRQPMSEIVIWKKGKESLEDGGELR